MIEYDTVEPSNDMKRMAMFLFYSLIAIAVIIVMSDVFPGVDDEDESLTEPLYMSIPPLWWFDNVSVNESFNITSFYLEGLNMTVELRPGDMRMVVREIKDVEPEMEVEWCYKKIGGGD